MTSCDVINIDFCSVTEQWQNQCSWASQNTAWKHRRNISRWNLCGQRVRILCRKKKEVCSPLANGSADFAKVIPPSAPLCVWASWLESPVRRWQHQDWFEPFKFFVRNLVCDVLQNIVLSTFLVGEVWFADKVCRFTVKCERVNWMQMNSLHSEYFISTSPFCFRTWLKKQNTFCCNSTMSSVELWLWQKIPPWRSRWFEPPHLHTNCFH